MTLALPTFSTVRSEIAGLSILELTASYGTPLYVYDQAVIDQRIADLAAFDVIRYAQKANSNLAILDRARRKGVLVDAVSAGEMRRALAAGYSADSDVHEIVYTADIFDRESLDLVDRTWPARQLRVARHDRPARRATAGGRSDLANQSRFWTRPQPEDQHRWRPQQAWHLAHSNRRMPGPSRASTT